MLNIPVILGSVRQGRKSEAPAKYIVEKVKAAGYESQLVDFKELPLPFFDSELLPVQLKGQYPHPNVQKWSEIARAADAFILIVSEYNHGYTAVLKNALDWLFPELEKKAFGLVGVSSGTIAGARAVEQIRPIISNFNGADIREAVMVGPVKNYFDDNGKLIDSSLDKKIDGLLNSLAWWGEALKERRLNDKN